jgi:hypothetical protein
MAAVQTAFSPKQIVRFAGYTELQPGMPPLLTAGERVVIKKVREDNGGLVLVVSALDRKGDNGKAINDEVFTEEVEVIAEETAAPASKAKATKAKTAKAEVVSAKPAKAEKPAKAAKPVKAAKPAKAVEVPSDATDFEEQTLKGSEPVEEFPVDTTDVVVVEDTPEVRDILNNMTDAHAAALALVEQGEKTDFTLGGVLAKIYNSNYFTHVKDRDGNAYDGKRGFADYVEDALGLQYRKAMYLIKIYTSFRALQFDEKKLAEIGWSKGKELARLAKLKDEEGNSILQRDFDELAEYAQENTREELIEHLKTTYLNATKPDRTKQIKFTYKLVGEQAENVERIMNDVKSAQPEITDNQVFEQIVTEWAMISGNLTLDQAIAQLQNQYGVTLAVVEGEVDAEEGTVSE